MFFFFLRQINDTCLLFIFQINGVRLDLFKHDDIETLGKLVFGKIDKTQVDKFHIDAYRYLLIIMKSVMGLNTFNSDK